MRDAAGHDAAEMVELRIDIQGEAVKADPFAQADADGGDLVLGHRAVRQARALRPLHPDPDAILAPLALDVHVGQRADDHIFERGDEGAHTCFRRLRSSIT